MQLQNLTIISAAIISLCVGCTAKIKNLSAVTYIHPNLTTQSIMDNGIAVLPVVAGRGQESYRRPLAHHISTYADSAMAGRTCLGWETTMQRLNEAGLIADYQAAINAYATTSIIDQSLLMKIGTELEVRYLLFPSLEGALEKQQKTTYSQYGSVTQEKTTCSAFCQVWDTASGNVVWEGFGQSETITTPVISSNATYDDYSRVAAQGLINELFGTSFSDKKKSSTSRYRGRR